MVLVILFYTKEYYLLGDLMKRYLKALMYTGIGILGLTLIVTILHYFNLLNETVVNVIKLLTTIISIGIGGFIVGKACEKKGWLEGLKYAGIIIVIFALLTLIFKLGFTINTLIYYLIIVISSTIGSMIGINMKDEKK